LNSQKVIRSYLTISGIYTLSASLIWGITTLFLLDAGLDILEVFIANAVFTGAMVVFEIPTGVVADLWGRRASFLLSVIVLILGTVFYIWAAQNGGTLLLFSLASVVLGLGFTFYSGAVEAWLVDALEATSYDGGLDHIFSRGALISGAAMLIGTTSGGFLGNINLALPFFVRIGLLVIVFFIAWRLMHDLGFKPRHVSLRAIPQEVRNLTRTSIQYGVRDPSIRLLMYGSFVGMGFMVWAWYAWQPYFLELLGNQDAVWVTGLIAASMALAAMAGNSLVEFFTRFCGKRTTLLISGWSVFTLAMIGVGLAQSFPLAVGLFLVANVALGVVSPVKQAYLHQMIPSEQRATVVSFDSLVGSGGGVIGQTGLGYISRNFSIPNGYILGGITTALIVPFMLKLRRRGDDVDLIIGSAGTQSQCAAQGIPDASGVDTTPLIASGTD
jgi:MFS family permease